DHHVLHRALGDPPVDVDADHAAAEGHQRRQRVVEEGGGAAGGLAAEVDPVDHVAADPAGGDVDEPAPARGAAAVVVDAPAVDAPRVAAGQQRRRGGVVHGDARGLAEVA